MKYLTSEDLTDWLLYAQAEPFGAVRDDQRFGTLASMLFNGFLREKGSAAMPAESFFPNWDNPPPDAAPLAPESDDPADLSNFFVESMIFMAGEAPRKG